MAGGKCKPDPHKNKEETIKLIRDHVCKDGGSGDPLNVNILKKKLYPRRDEDTSLKFKEAYAVGAFIADLGRGQLVPQILGHGNIQERIKNYQTYQIRSIALAVAFQTAGMTPKEIAGICSGVFDWDIPEYVDPKSIGVIDNCGMGGDDLFTPNISTVALLSVANYAGIKTCKHGSPGNTDAAGSSDFVAYLVEKITKEVGLEGKINLDKPFSKIIPQRTAEIIDDVGFGYIEAVDARYKTIHMQTHMLANISHINDILGPITLPINPKKVTRKIVGVNHLISTRLIADAYIKMNNEGVTNLQNAYFVRGRGKEIGMDEFSNLAETEITILKDGKIYETRNLTPEEDFGIKTYRSLEPSRTVQGRTIYPGISPEVGKEEDVFPNGKKNTSLMLLKNEKQGPQRDLVIMNMSPILVLGGAAKDFRDGAELADQLLSEKHGYHVAKEFVRALAE